MSERQVHGFNFQNLICNKLFNDYSGAYIDKFDVPLEESSKYGFNTNISIKSIKINQAIELGSLLRFYENVEPFTMIIGWHLNNEICSINEYVFSHDILKKLKGNVPLEIVKELHNNLSIKNYPVGQHEQARQYFKEIKLKYKKDFGLLTFTGKVDSKTQRRWQCNINNTNFKKLFGNLMLQTTYRNIDIKCLEP